jgi:cytochrome P450
MEAIAHRKELHRFFAFVANRMVFTDPPQHTRLRRLTCTAFTPHVIEGMRDHIQAVVDGFLDRAQEQGRMDLIADLAFPLPATIIAELLGVPPADRDRLKQWSDAFILIISSDPHAIPVAVFERAARAADELTAYFRAIVDQRRAAPRHDLLTMLEQAQEADGSRLSDDELFATANILMVAGHETTTNLIGNGTLALLRHPDQLQKLRDDPSLLPSAVEELLRYDSPVQAVYRVAAEDLELAGRQVRKGQVVHLVLGAANRDPAHFPDPDRLDVTRSPGRHLAFGQGPHFCLGSPLARLEAGIALRSLLDRFPDLRPAADRVTFHPNPSLRGLTALPLTW